MSSSAADFGGQLPDADGLWSVRRTEGALPYPDEAHRVIAEVEDRSFWFRHRNRVIGWMLRAYPIDGAFLDVGGGNGFQSLMLQQQWPTVVMVEPGIVGCRTARDRGVRRVVHGTLEELALPQQSVGGIGLFDVLEHIVDARALLNESASVLRRAGRLFVTVPAFRCLWSREDDFAQHARRYTEASLRAEIEAAGFRIERCAYFFGPLFLPVLLLRALPYRLSRRPAVLDPYAAARTAGHTPPGFVDRLMNSRLDRELRALAADRAPAFGSSVLCVATVHG